MESVTVFDLESYLSRSENWEDVCRRAFEHIRDTGVLIIRDPRVSEDDNNRFVDLMEAYYDQDDDVKRKDARPDLSYQVGVTPNDTEVPRDHQERMSILQEKDAAHPVEGADPKWRFHWRMGDRPVDTKFPELNAQPVIPEAFADVWADTMNMWGGKMLQAVTTVSRMLAVGCGLPEGAFADRMKYGPHLLAPTGSDLNRHDQVGTVLAGYHYDLNFLTIHGKSRFPGLFVWLRDGTKMPVRVPDGCLLVQAAKQIEWLTGGEIMAGFHEVVVTEDTLKAIDRAKAAGRPCWRVSSTMFSHIASDVVLEPLEHFCTPATKEAYPPTFAGDQVNSELKEIALSATM